MAPPPLPRRAKLNSGSKASRIASQPDDEIVLGQAYNRNADNFARLQRRIDTAHRNYRNALQELRASRPRPGEHVEPLEKPAQPQPPEPRPDPLTPQEQSPKASNGFVPQTTPEVPAELLTPKPLPTRKDYFVPEESELKRR